jgi:hypothetical protein
MTEKIDNFFGAYSLLSLIFTPPSRSHVYAYSRNQTLLEMSFDELREIPDLRTHYLQVDIQNKFVPVDWFLGYDTYVIYSFVNLVGFGPQKGYLKTLLRDEPFWVDFEKDFIGSSGQGLWRHFETKAWLLIDTLWSLMILMCCTVAIGKVFLYSLSKNIVDLRV